MLSARFRVVFVISRDSEQAEAILKIATQLFAALGYDGTSTRQIADAAGLNVATVNYHVGGKRDLYLAVMGRANLTEQTALAEAAAALAAASPPEAPAALHRLLDRYVDVCVEHPEIPSLWMHRWLSDAGDITSLEREYVQPLITLITEALAPLPIDPEVDVEYALWSVIWCVNGFARGGVLDRDGTRKGAGDVRAVQHFRSHLHLMVHRTLGLPGEVP